MSLVEDIQKNAFRNNGERRIAELDRIVFRVGRNPDGLPEGGVSLNAALDPELPRTPQLSATRPLTLGYYWQVVWSGQRNL